MNRLVGINVDLRQPIARGHRRQFGLHDIQRRHGIGRYEVPPREVLNQQRRAHPQYHQWHWECENNRWIWLRPNFVNLTRSRCIVCHVNLAATITNIRNHEETDRHRGNMENINVPIDPQFDPHLNREEFEDEKAVIKILLCTWFADESVAYQKIDTLLPLIKRIARYPEALQEVKLSRTTLSKIIKDIIAPVHKQEVALTLARTKFATLFDESTGVSKDKSGCLLLRFADNLSYRIRTTVWDLIPIYREDDEHSDETAESLYNLTINSLFGEQLAVQENRAVLRLNNYIASGTDGCNTMIGVNNSVRQRLYDNFEGINHITCPCHSAHLCARHAMQRFFAAVIQVLQDSYNWFRSAKRLHRLHLNQIALDLDVHQLLRFVDTRWLTGLPSLLRISEQIIAIEQTLAEVPDNPQAMQLLQRLRSPSIQYCIAFLSFILEVPEDFNGWMQTEEVIFPEVFNRICEDFKDILLCYMREDYVQHANLVVIDVEDPQQFLPYDDMRIGDEARQIARGLPEDEYINIMETTRRYLIHLATEWLEQLVLPWERYACTECLLIENALSIDYHADNPDIIQQLIDQFPRALPNGMNEENVEMIAMEWDLLIQNHRDLELPPGIRTEYFWFVVRDIVEDDGFYPYVELANFALDILCTPHSNAQPERIWSVEKYIKNKWRNKLSIGSVRAILLIKEMLALRNCTKTVHRFIPNPEMIARVRQRLYDIRENINPQAPADSDEENSDEEELTDDEEPIGGDEQDDELL